MKGAVALSAAPAAPSASFSLSSFGVALIACLLAYDGWVQLTFVAGEIRDPQKNVLRALVIGGLANKEIAAALRLSPRTVEKHVENLLRKTGARSRTELAVTSRHPTT